MGTPRSPRVLVTTRIEVCAKTMRSGVPLLTMDWRIVLLISLEIVVICPASKCGQAVSHSISSMDIDDPIFFAEFSSNAKVASRVLSRQIVTIIFMPVSIASSIIGQSIRAVLGWVCAKLSTSGPRVEQVQSTASAVLNCSSISEVWVVMLNKPSVCALASSSGAT